VNHFLVVYDRGPGQLIRLERHDSGGAAMQARFRAEAEFRGRPQVEIVALAAASERDLLRTHGRYFLGLDELAARMSSAA
jgi:hypothetical protein